MNQNVDKDLEYYCRFGNRTEVHYKYKTETLQHFWKRMCQFSFSDSIGDVSLFYKGKLSRSCWNWNKKVYPKRIGGCKYNKYKTKRK